MKKYKRIFENIYDFEEKYKYFNNLYFDNLLPKLPFDHNINSKKVLAQVIYIKKIPKAIEINNTKFNLLSDKNKDAVLIHEMIHVWVTIKGYDKKGNLHQGEFLKKAKEIENKSNLNISGRMHKDSDDLNLKYKDTEKKNVYVVIKTYFSKLLKKNTISMDFYSSLNKAINSTKNNISQIIFIIYIKHKRIALF